MQRALKVGSSGSRDFAPESVWLLLVPVVNLCWWFPTVLAVGRSLRREYAEQNMDRGGSYGVRIGFFTGAAAIASLVAIGSVLVREFVDKTFSDLAMGLWVGGVVLGFASFTSWAIYWGTISNHMEELVDEDHRRRFRTAFRADDEDPRRQDDRNRIDDRYR
jgi:hypothetical protein